MAASYAVTEGMESAYEERKTEETWRTEARDSNERLLQPRVLLLAFPYTLTQLVPRLSCAPPAALIDEDKCLRAWSTTVPARPRRPTRHSRTSPRRLTASTRCTTSTFARNATRYDVTTVLWLKLAATTVQTVSLRCLARVCEQRRTGMCQLSRSDIANLITRKAKLRTKLLHVSELQEYIDSRAVRPTR